MNGEKMVRDNAKNNKARLTSSRADKSITI